MFADNLQNHRQAVDKSADAGDMDKLARAAAVRLKGTAGMFQLLHCGKLRRIWNNWRGAQDHAIGHARHRVNSELERLSVAMPSLLDELTSRQSVGSATNADLTATRR